MDVFEIIKDTLNMKQVATYYGIKINKHNKAICPFHSDTHPSLSVKDKYFKCFVCEAKGGIIEFVMLLFGLSNIKAAEKLSEDFGLRLFENKSSSGSEYREIKEYARKNSEFKIIMGNFDCWKKYTEKYFLEIFRSFQDVIKNLPPEYDKDPLEIWAFAIHNKDRLEYYLDIFTKGDDEIIKNYKNIERYRKEIAHKINFILRRKIDEL